jgi:hypothetical protein
MEVPMRQTRAKIALVSLLITAIGVPNGRSQQTASDRRKLLGTWRLVSAVYDDKPNTEVGKSEIQIKHITDVQFTWLTYSVATKQVRSGLGGTYSVNVNSYSETPEYGFGEAIERLHDTEQKFTCRIEGDRWYQDGRLSVGMKLEEVWERVK